MTPASQQFSWKDRDAAAHDLLQFANTASESIRTNALHLLQAFHSDAIFSELEQIVMDEEQYIWNRRYALRAIASIRGDIYVPQFARFNAPGSWDTFSFDDLIPLIRLHPRNAEWMFQKVETCLPTTYIEALTDMGFYSRKGEGLNPILCQKIMEVIDQHPHLLTLELVDTLRLRDGSEVILNWLRERWDTLIYLCLVGETWRVYYLLKSWEELREAVYKHCPAMLAEHEQYKVNSEFWWQSRLAGQNTYETSGLWKEMNGWHLAALDGDQEGFDSLAQVIYHEWKLPFKRAAAAHFLGKLKDKYDVRPPLFYVLLQVPNDPRNPRGTVNISTRFEAGEALRDLPLPDVWETMVEAFFVRPENFLDVYMVDWIEHLTDRLSGIDAPYTGGTYSMNQRRWFRDLAEVQT